MNTLVTWENLQARLFHLGWLGEELPEFVSSNGAPAGAWLFRQIVTEATTVAAIAAAYVAECVRAGLSGPHGTTPAPASWRCANESRPDPGRPLGDDGALDGAGDNTPTAGDNPPGGGADRRHDREGGDAL